MEMNESRVRDVGGFPLFERRGSERMGLVSAGGQ